MLTNPTPTYHCPFLCFRRCRYFALPSTSNTHQHRPWRCKLMRASWLTSWDRSQTSMMHCSMIQNDQVTKMLEIYQQDSSVIIICDFHYVSIIQLALRTYLIFLTNRRAGVNPTERNGDKNSSAEKTTRYRRQNSHQVSPFLFCQLSDE